MDLHVSVSVLSLLERAKKIIHLHNPKFNASKGWIGKYPRSFIGNMDETPAFFDMIPAKSICKTISKECVFRTSGCEKKYVTIALSATADSKMLPYMII